MIDIVDSPNIVEKISDQLGASDGRQSWNGVAKNKIERLNSYQAVILALTAKLPPYIVSNMNPKVFASEVKRKIISKLN